MKRVVFFIFLSAFIINMDAKRVRVNYSVISVPEEGGIKFEKITDDADAVAAPFATGNSKSVLNLRFGKQEVAAVTWWVNPLIAISPDGSKIGYVNDKNSTKNMKSTLC